MHGMHGVRFRQSSAAVLGVGNHRHRYFRYSLIVTTRPFRSPRPCRAPLRMMNKLCGHQTPAKCCCYPCTLIYTSLARSQPPSPSRRCISSALLSATNLRHNARSPAPPLPWVCANYSNGGAGTPLRSPSSKRSGRQECRTASSIWGPTIPVRPLYSPSRWEAASNQP